MLVSPLLVFQSYQMDFEPRLFYGLLQTLFVSFVTFLVCIILAEIFMKGDPARQQIEKMTAIYSNCGFIGIPLINGILGAEGVIARGDRRQGKAILLAWQRGCKMDGWDQCFDFDKWMQAFRDCGLDPEFYASRQRPMDEVFPWDHIGCGTRKEHLKREWERSREAAITPDCMHQCAGCGASALLKGGKCHV